MSMISRTIHLISMQLFFLNERAQYVAKFERNLMDSTITHRILIDKI